jgi:hypothetical protein
MTTVEPTDDQGTLLGSLVATSHLRLTDLLREVGRDSGTPGVRPSIDRQLDHDLRAHLVTMAQVLDRDLTGDERRAVEDDHHALLAALDRFEEAGDVEASRLLVGRFGAHVQQEEGPLLESLRHRVGDRHMAALGMRYAEVADTHLD